MPHDVVKIRCPIHGFIEIRRQSELPVLDHPGFQRLRRVSQLAMAYLAFPGATHTRFEHSLGALHVADRLARGVRVEPHSDTLSNIRLAALVHDIGHGPFSHVSEDAFRELGGASGETEHSHESITREIVRRELRGKVLSAQQAGAIEALLSPKPYGRSYEQDIISGPLDADQLDYLLRDSYFCGVRYGVYDLDRLLETVTVVEDTASKQTYLGVMEEDLPAVDQYVLARHNLGQVYFHKVRRIADAMLVRSITRAVHEGHPEVTSIYAPRERIDTTYIQQYLHTDDETLVRCILREPRKPSAELMRRLRRRQLVKQVFSAPLSRCGDAVFRQRIATREGQQELEREIANMCSRNRPWLVFVHFQEGRPLRKGAGQDGPETIPVVCANGKQGNYDAVSPVFRFGAHRGGDYLHVYAPVREDSDRERKRARDDLEKRVAALIGLSDRPESPWECPRCGRELPARDQDRCPVCGQEPDDATKKEEGNA